MDDLDRSIEKRSAGDPRYPEELAERVRRVRATQWIDPVGPAVTLAPAEVVALQCIAPFEEIAERVILARTLKNMTQEQLANAVGTSVSYVSRIESGTARPGRHRLRKLSLVLGWDS